MSDVNTEDPILGQEIGNLVVKEMIGRGGFGAVYRAEHRALGTSFAVKTLHLFMQKQEAVTRRFQREAKTIAQLSHNNIVRVSDFGNFPDGTQYLVMEYLVGKPLDEILSAKEPISADELLSWTRQLCSALGFIHRKKMAHRDIKPANIFLAQDPDEPEATVKLLDFGIVGITQNTQLTTAGTMMGSPRYMSPEQAEGRSGDADARSDLYSLAIVLYELLIGETPFQGNLSDLVIKHIGHQPPPLFHQRPNHLWAAEIEEFFQHAMEKQAQARFQTAQEFLEAFEEAFAVQMKLKGPQTFPISDADIHSSNTTPLSRDSIAFYSKLTVDSVDRSASEPPPSASTASYGEKQPESFQALASEPGLHDSFEASSGSVKANLPTGDSSINAAPVANASALSASGSHPASFKTRPLEDDSMLEVSFTLSRSASKKYLLAGLLFGLIAAVAAWSMLSPPQKKVDKKQAAADALRVSKRQARLKAQVLAPPNRQARPNDQVLAPQKPPSAQQVTLLLTTAPPFVQVSRGKKVLGTTPYRLQGKPGASYTLTLYKRGYQRKQVTGTFSTTTQQTRRETLALKPTRRRITKRRPTKVRKKPKARKADPFGVDFKIP